MRTVDAARLVGCSVQHLRNLETSGVIPPADRTPSGYRRWTTTHVQSAIAYRELSRGAGPDRAREVVRATHQQPLRQVLALLDDIHADLARERRALAWARDAVADIATEPLASPRPSDAMTITELAAAIGTTTATLRHWEATGLLSPHRPGRTRSYPPTQVRDARVVHQLRTAGYPIPQIGAVLDLLADPRHPAPTLDAARDRREHQLTTRSTATLHAAAALRDLLVATTPSTTDRTVQQDN